MPSKKNEFRNWIKEKFIGEKGYIYVISFLAPIFVLLCIYIARGVYPFGDNMYLARDMYHQYAPFFSEFYNKLTGGGSLTYSWNIGMGTNFTGLYAYYLASPLNWSLALIDRNYLIEVMNIHIILKIALSSLTCTYYLRHHYKTKDFATVAISLFYALSAYTTAYSWNIMWLDCILLLPLILLGLERLVKDGKSYLYCISLGLAIISNYYIAYMICIYLVLYFLVLLFTNDTKKDWAYFKSRIGKFAVFSLLAGMVAAFLIIPEYFALKVSASGDMNFPDTLNRYFSIYEILSRGLMTQEISTSTANDPNIYSTILVYMIFPLYVIHPSKNSKEKVGKILLVAFFIISFNFNILNYIWHGFHFPNSLPARQSFIFIFLLLTMVYEVLINLSNFKDKHIYGAFAISLALLLSYEHLLVNEDFNYNIIYISILFLALYLLVIQMYRKISNKEVNFLKQVDTSINSEEYNIGIEEYESISFKKSLVIILFLLIATAESLVNFGATGLSVTSRPNYVDDNEAIDKLLTRLEERDDDFYRIEKYKRRTKNDGPWHDYKGVSVFSSTSSAPLNDYLGLLGFENSTNAYSFSGETPLTSSLFSVKYMLGKEGEATHNEESRLNSLIDEEEGEYLYENTFTLPLAFMLPSNFDMHWDTSSSDPFVVQNNFVKNLVPGNIFNEIITISSGSIVTLQIESNKEVYIYVPTEDVESLSFSVTDINGIEQSNETYEEYEREHIINLGSFEPGTYIHITSPESVTDLDVYAYTFDDDVFVNLYNKLNREPFNITTFEDTYIEGTINASQEGLMYTSIPFDKGWSVTIDGQEVQTTAFKDALLAVPITEGEHTVEFSYSPQGLKLGIIISITSVIIFIIIILKNRYNKNILKKEEEVLDNEIK